MTLPRPVDADHWRDATWPLGSISTPDGVTFAVYAPAASGVRLEIFEAAIAASVFTADCGKGPDGIWRAKVAGVEPGIFYGYRCWGPNWPLDPAWMPGSDAGFVSDVDPDGNRFNPNKLLSDPYARELSHTPYGDEVSSVVDGEGPFDPGMFGTGGDDYHGAPRRNFDTARWAPKGVVIDDASSFGRHPELPPEDAAIYEAHVVNLTAHPSGSDLAGTIGSQPGFPGVQDVPAELRGSYAGAAYLAPYLKSLGFSTIEFLPVHQSDAAPGHPNHWGYETLAFFAPNRAYAHDRTPGGPTREFKAMVKAFHDAGIEVFLDVVFNHTAEGTIWNGDRNTTGFTSFGGFAAPVYYDLTPDGTPVDGATGTHNQMNYSEAASRQLVTDCLSYWIDTMGIDGFRFDLAPVLGRLPENFPRDDWPDQRRFFSDHPLLVAIRELAEAKDVEVIAEAWDLWGYEVGQFPSGWGEWNGHYRDALRAFLKGDGNVGSAMAQIDGDVLDFNDAGGPQRSVNFLTAHDGFTMVDLVSYDQKRNDRPWPFGPSEGGTDDNLSWDSDGDHALRRQRVRNCWTVLFLSRGVPMVVAGDEYGRTQNGNNNPWALNTIGMWQNWGQSVAAAPTALPVDPDDPGISYDDNLGASQAPPGSNPIFRLASYVANLRRFHPALRQPSYGDATLGNADVTYEFRNATGGTPVEGDRVLRVHIDATVVEGDNQPGRPRSPAAGTDSA